MAPLPRIDPQNSLERNSQITGQTIDHSSFPGEASQTIKWQHERCLHEDASFGGENVGRDDGQQDQIQDLSAVAQSLCDASSGPVTYGSWSQS